MGNDKAVFLANATTLPSSKQAGAPTYFHADGMVLVERDGAVGFPPFYFPSDEERAKLRAYLEGRPATAAAPEEPPVVVVVGAGRAP